MTQTHVLIQAASREALAAGPSASQTGLLKRVWRESRGALRADWTAFPFRTPPDRLWNRSGALRA